MHARTLQPPTTVFASTATGLIQFIERMGGDPGKVLDEASFSEGVAGDPNGVIYLHQYCRAMARAAEYTGRRNFGLWFGQQYLPRQIGMMGYLGSSSPTLGEALRNMSDYFPLHQRNSRLELHVQGARALVTYACDEVMADSRHDVDLSLGQMLNMLREPLGRDWSPLQVRFAHERPAGWSEHRDVFGAEVLFEQECNGMLIRTADLETPMPYRDPLLMSVMKQSLRRFGEHHITVELSLAARTREEIRGLLRHGYPRLEDVAKRLGLPAWTFQRRLGEESASFKDLVEEVRVQDAPMLLGKKHLSISQVAELLGYSEISAFSRAFSRWYRVSPRQWRENAAAPETDAPSP